MRHKPFRCVLLSLFVSATAAVPFLHAQDTSSTQDAPKVLVIQREMTKPGKDGKQHEAAEAAYTRALTANNGKIRYIALTSFSGQNRALFMSGYPSLAAWETERKGIGPELQTALDQASSSDGDLLSETAQSIWLRRDDLSSNVKGMGTGTRFTEIGQYVIKPGHVKEWQDVVKMYKDASANIPEFHWTTYELAYGNFTGPSFLIVSSAKSMGDLDAEFGAGKKFGEALGEDGRKKLAELEASCLQSEMTNLFAINPRMSSPPDEAVQAEPAFWRPEAAETAAKK